MASLIGLYERHSPPRNKRRIPNLKRFVRQFVAIVGDVRVVDVRNAHAVAFRDGLSAAGMTPDTSKAYLSGLHRLFVTAISQGVVTSNPFAGVLPNRPVVVKFSAKQTKRDFTPEEIRAVLVGLPSIHADRQWITKILIWHGARSGEIATMKPSDVTVSHGIPILRITDEGDRNVKNEHSLRDVPIHPKCTGIVGYAAAAAAAGHTFLFNGFTESRDRAMAFQRDGRKFLDSIGITDRRVTMYCLRDRWITCARELDMPWAVSRALTGHSIGGDEHSSYGTVPSLAKRRKWLNKVDPTR